jgi:hypothetical protein
MYCGQAGGFAPNNADWLGLPLRLMKYEKTQRADHSKQAALRNERNERNTQSKTLHIYMLCSHPDVQVHARCVAISPISATTHQQLQDLEYDLPMIESVLSILLGTIMSPEGEKSYKADCLQAGRCPLGTQSPSSN